MIVHCPMCHNGKVRQYVEPEPSFLYNGGRLPEFWHEPETVEVDCPRCGGAQKWREPAGEFTPLDRVPADTLREMARIMPWLLVDSKSGVVRFVSGPGLPSDDNGLLELLRLTSSIGAELERWNWLVYY